MSLSVREIRFSGSKWALGTYYVCLLSNEKNIQIAAFLQSSTTERKKFFKEYISESAVETRVMFFQLKKLFLSMLAVAGGRLIPSTASSS